jgi:hypothetical protein
MPSSRIFVSYVCLGDEPGSRTGKQLLNDIRAANTEAVSDHETISDERFMPFLMRELPQCGSLIVVQTPAALQSWRVQRAVAMASALTAQHQMQMMRVIAAPSPSANEQPLWAALPTFDASVDYPRVREKIFLALGLTQFDTGDSFVFELSALPAPGLPEPIGRYPSSQSPVSHLAGSGWSEPPPGRSPQSSTPLAVSRRTNASSGAGGFLCTPAPLMDPAFQPTNQPGSVLSQIWSRVQACFAQFWRVSRTTIAALSGEADKSITLRSDHPQPLTTTRQFVIRRTIVIAGLLILILAVALLAVLVDNHLHR